MKYEFLSNKLIQKMQEHSGWKEPQDNVTLLSKVMSFSHHMKCESFLFRQSRKLVVHIGLYESSLVLQRRFIIHCVGR